MSASLLLGLLAFASLGFAPTAQEQVIDQFQPEDRKAMIMSSDPCSFLPACDDPETAAKIWIAEVFLLEDQQSALEVARWESAHTFDTSINNYEGSDASGLFQHRKRYWSEDTKAKRELKARQWFAEEHHINIDEPLDIYNGWHSAIVAAWLVYETSLGWKHFHSCASGARHALKYLGVGGGGWVKTC